MIAALLPRLSRTASLAWLALLLGGGAVASAEDAAERWIHDQLRVDMRSGPTFQNRIIDFLASGTPITVLETREEWIRIRAKDKEGWIQAQYTTGTPVAAARLEAAQRELAGLVEERDRLADELSRLRGEAGDLDSAYAEASSEVQRLEAELARIRETSARALETAAALETLQGEARAMRSRVDELSDENLQLRNDNLSDGIKWGLGAVVAGALLAWIAASFGKRRRRTDWA
ncbi:MAG: TIGR04211 family SH3 domain-containing protein [Pseudomonadales bacterium]|jgi:SH3 domain protein|nr:TIGR04211 family SH3 domain-containing protein [Pseudomonadales bacterium]